MNDPVGITACERGYVVMVCDYAGKKIIGFRIGTITDNTLNPPVSYPCGQEGGFEISGFLAIPGNPRDITDCNVN